MLTLNIDRTVNPTKGFTKKYRFLPLNPIFDCYNAKWTSHLLKK